ncbi:MAG: rhodanese-related sulfurtransferase [Hydrotalea flava]|uniref:oxygen-dependent tRNA uridine(34) hydroxylase TrhO n=1 Tax=Hydrotalea TaxID=1004300 RepID=UPI00102708E3|nr:MULTISPECIES: rhodanese-related sulfurtransferase [Hydrotalea]MBY0347360.1 rhodanese-related sulfurtransferase [Hydrotalea flava]NIM34502.1 rhodanese-related sulfurtransferase [Hydrotalea flava]NIM37342.1 rhodanese-related sulfurtransferase [Hydrotalea flava]NIN02527.1 rhodanese-related sulfurtransferase [Hydrotalea flava]NIN14187.1 rhodanese-related sulfurtransferase [Hydrotalea flava]
MALLHNRINNEELKKRLMEEKEPRITVSFYQYFEVSNPLAFRDYLYKHLHALKVFGRIYIAKEGINAQASVPESNFEAFKTFLYSIEPLNGLRINIAVDDDGKSFWVLKVKVREKIVADGINDPDFNMYQKGKYVDAITMNRLLADPNTIVIDMRNHYEYEVGHFVKALEVPSDTFREQLPMAVEMMKGNEDKNIIMYCTGGIRCEKASAYMLHKGFKNVYHLEGGIINYARQTQQLGLESYFKGKNFVFDNRLGERITPDVIAHCHQCGNPCDTHTNCKNDGCHLLFIQCDECATKYNGCCSEACAETIHLPVERQKQIRKGIDKGQNIFHKSKARLRPRLNEINGV